MNRERSATVSGATSGDSELPVGGGDRMSQVARSNVGPIRVCMHVIGVGRTDMRVIREATALVEAGYDVTLVDFERDSSRPAREDMQGVHFHHIVMPSRFVKSRVKLWFLVKFAVLVLRSIAVLIRTRADVYHAHEDNALYACYVAATLRGAPLIFDAHELPLVQPHLTRWRRLCAIARWMLRRMMARCVGVISVSPPIIDELQQRYGGPRATLVRNIPPYTPPIASDRLRQRLGLGPEARIALYQGGLLADRSLDILVRAAPYLRAGEIIVLMGSGPYQQTLVALIQQAGVDERVKLLPPVPYAELLGWTASADVGLVVYDSGYSLNTQLCLPNKLFEYLMAGLPIMATPLDAVAEVVGDYEVGVVASSIEPEVVAQTLSRLLGDEGRQRRMREHALAAAHRELRWEVEQRRLIELYAQTVGAPVDVAPRQGEAR